MLWTDVLADAWLREMHSIRCVRKALERRDRMKHAQLIQVKHRQKSVLAVQIVYI